MSETKIVVEEKRIDLSLNEIEATIVLGTSGPQGPRGSQLLSGASEPSPVIGLIGDHYIQVNSGKLYGPKTSSGWGEGVTVNPIDPESLGYVHVQLSPETQWNIIHPLVFVPNIVVVDSEGEVVEGFYEYLDENNIRATFSNPISGKAYLS
jgi:hypothetical protein